MRVSPSCRDKGRMWGRVGALCLSSSLFDSLGFREARWSHPHEDKHKAPSSTPLRPLSLQDPGTHLPRFGRQHSLGLDLAGGEELSRSFEPCLSTGQRSPKIEVTDLWIAQNFVVCSFQPHLSALHHDPTC